MWMYALPSSPVGSESAEAMRPRAAPGAFPAALLTKAAFHGTLAAVRSLGRAGIAVTVADPNGFAPAGRSKYAVERFAAPDVRDVGAYLRWLERFAARHGPRVLLPVNDDTAWLYARHREQLSLSFHLAPTTVEQIYPMLNKRLLHQLAASVGMRVPETRYPHSPGDVRRCAGELAFPVVVKPATQVMFVSQSKGIRVAAPDQLETAYQRLAAHPYRSELLAFDPQARWPVVQQFYPGAASGIYNISGFAFERRICVARAARKILQQPRKLGTGVCFEAAQVIADLQAGLERLVAAIGFEGVFEAEFIEADDGAVLIDFNPRFYNQLGFDVARGLPLPLLAYHHALGNRDEVRKLIAAIPEATSAADAVYVDILALRVLVGAQRVSGALSAAEANEWRRWLRDHRHHCVHAVRDRDDPWPTWFDLANVFARHGRHPLGFFRSIVLNR